jgi:hypothetical protein
MDERLGEVQGALNIFGIEAIVAIDSSHERLYFIVPMHPERASRIAPIDHPAARIKVRASVRTNELTVTRKD